jgi:hypothetical protein
VHPPFIRLLNRGAYKGVLEGLFAVFKKTASKGKID